MKKFITKVQDLGQKAAQLKQAMENVPARAAELREAVARTTGQLQQMRADVQSSVTTLRTDSEERLVQALREIDESAETFRAAGYELEDVEMELAVPQRLIVHLEKHADVREATLRALLAASENRRTTHAILFALIKAEELADKVDLANLSYHKLMVYVGAIPSVRLCWRAESVTEAALAPSGAFASASESVAPFSSSSLFGQSSFFEPRAPVPLDPAASASLESAVPPEPPAASEPAASAAASGDWRKDALERFKKMPDLSKR